MKYFSLYLRPQRLFAVVSIFVFITGSLNFTSCSKDDPEKKVEQPTTPTPTTPDPLTPATKEVGPDKPFKTLQEVASQLQPGDIVDVYGDQEYVGGIVFDLSGTLERPITIRGKLVNGKRPVIKAGPKDRIIVINGENFILDGLEVVGVTNVSKAGVGVYANNIVIRNCVIHDSRNGVLGYGSGTGNVTIEYCEIYNCGADPSNGQDFAHQIYVATDEAAHPDAVFRLQHCYIHSSGGGNNVKSRSGRNEIYYNWIQDAKYHALDLIGVDVDDNDAVQHDTKREDSDIVGNVIYGTADGSIARVGGDGTGSTSGRYRFVNNTFILRNNADGVRGQDEIQTVELYNNIFIKTGEQADVFSEGNVEWVSGRQLKGANNYIQSGFSKIPAGLTGTLQGNEAILTDVAAQDLSLKTSSNLINGGIVPASFTGFEFPSPLFPPKFHPPIHRMIVAGSASPRPENATIDVGAFER